MEVNVWTRETQDSYVSTFTREEIMMCQTTDTKIEAPRWVSLDLGGGSLLQAELHENLLPGT